jgi:hypothetical protein
MQMLQGEYVTLETARHYAVNWSRIEMGSHGFAPATPGILKPGPDRRFSKQVWDARVDPFG